MATTLWFTDEEKADGMPRDILACGQFTTCYNLLSYLYDQQKDGAAPTRLSPLAACESQLLDAWQRFQKDPYWLVDEIL